VLLEALRRLDNVPGDAYVLDPKAVKKEELYGNLDATTREWSDGVFTAILRKILDNLHGAKEKRHWIVFDGDVDPEWVENLNSVLDDNKLLTLPNGERLALPSSVRIVFEVQNLAYATPATVSRCGMVWFSDDTVTTSMISKRYLNMLRGVPIECMADPQIQIGAKKGQWPPQGMAMERGVQVAAANVLAPHMEAEGLVERCLEYTSKQDHIMDFTPLRCLTSLFSLISRAVANVIEYNASHPDFAMPPQTLEAYLSRQLLLAILWGFGGSTSLASREKFGQFIGDTTTIPTPDQTQGPTLIDFEVNVDDGEWSLWRKKVPNVEIETSRAAAADVLIATVDTVRHEELLRGYFNERRPFILCGPPGSGKTMTITAALRGMTEVTLVPLNFSSATQPELILKTFEHYCEYRRTPDGIVLRPVQAGTWLVIFCDECNLPSADRYGTQRVVTFMRQLTELGGFWRSSDLSWVSLERIQFIGACNPPTDAGRVPVSHRYLRHAPLLYVDFPGVESLKQIYGTYTRALLNLTPQLRANASPLTDAMVDMYVRCRDKFTSEKQSHYIFSPRELSRWMRGLFEAVTGKDDLTIEELLQLWAHEGLRLFQDRLVEDEEREWLDKNLDECAGSTFPHVNTSKALERPLLFCHWLTRDYSRVDADQLRDFVKARLRVFCEEEFNVQLVVFNSVLDHILRIDRVLRQPLGHALLIGASGAGKTVLSRFVAWMNGLSVFNIKAHRGYTVHDFEDDLRKVMKRAGCKGEKICFIFDESNVLDAGFLELMNALLASGEVPGLFEAEEYTALMQACKEAAARDNLMVDTEDELFKRFTQQVQRNLHVVFTMNPASSDFQNRTTTSPALFNRCVIDWVGDWSADALLQVASEFTERLDLDDAVADQAKTDPEAVVDSLVFVHQSVGKVCAARSGRMGRHYYITPRHYLDFIQHFVKLFKEKREEVQDQQLHLNLGLEKLRQTEEDVSNLKGDLALKEEELKAKNQLANDKLQQMVQEQQEAERQREQSVKLSGELAVQAQQAEERQALAQLDLDKAEPMVEEARRAVKDVKKQQLDELRTMGNPPAPVKLALEAVCQMVYNMPKPSWDDIRRTIRKDDFIKSILDFDTNALQRDPKKIKLIKAYTDNPDFAYETVNRSSKACGPLAKWCTAQITYADVLEKVDPLRQQIAGLEAKKAALGDELGSLTEKIAQLETSIGQYKEEYAALIAEVQNIKTEMKTVSDKVVRSTALLGSLSQERARWETQKASFSEAMSTMVGDVLLAAAFLAYCGMFEQETRRVLLHQWMNRLDTAKVMCKPDLSLVEFLSTGDSRLAWHGNGLPEDDLCVENAIMLARYNRYPLVIDPSGQAIDYLMQQHAGSKMMQTSFLDAGFLKQLESCMRFGTPLLVTDVERVDPILNPVLNKEVHKAGGRALIRLGENDIDLSPAFTLFLSTRDSNYHFAPDLCSRVTLVNFTITPAGLQSQCLTLILKAERADVDQKRSDLLKLQGEYRVRLRQLETQLLTSLSEAKGNILEDDHVIGMLEGLKRESGEVEKKMSQTEEVMEEVQRVSAFYVPLATACSRVFFVLDGLYSLHFLYQYSIAFFFSIFDSVLNRNANLNGVVDPAARLGVLMKDLFGVSFARAARSLLNQDQLVVALRMVQVRLQCRGEDLDGAHLDFLLKGGPPLHSKDAGATDAAHWLKLSPVQGARLQDLAVVHGFAPVVKHMQEAASAWIEWLSSSAPEHGVPAGCPDLLQGDSVNACLARLLLLKTLRPDRVLAGGSLVVSAVFGPEFLNIQETDLAAVAETECSARVPIMLVSLPGFDTSGRVDALAAEKRINYRALAMGSPEGYDQAERAIFSLASKGGWVLLKNVHLAPQWLQQLEKRLHSLDAAPAFRLFMTMEISPAVPSSLLRTAQVIVYEPPVGMKASLQRTIASIPAERFNREPAERPRMFLLLAWLHGVVLGRLRYATLGWTKKYEFSEADQKGSLDAVDSWLDSVAQGRSNVPPNRIPWHAIRTLLGEACYGGKIDNEFDVRALASFVERFMNPDCFGSEHCLSPALDDGSGKICVPDGSSRAAMVEWVQTLPDQEPPTWLGLPARADQLLRSEQGREALSSLLQLQAGLDEAEVEAEDSSFDKTPAWAKEALRAATDFLQVLPVSLTSSDFLVVLPGDKKRDEEGPVARFMRREVMLGTALLAKVRSQLAAVQAVLDGKGTGSNETRSLTQHLSKGTLPPEWAAHHALPASTSVREWIGDLSRRLKQLDTLAPDELDPAARPKGARRVWVGGLFQVEGFFTATRQEMARSKEWPLELLTLRYAPDSDAGERVGSFVVEGAAVTGCTWENSSLVPGREAASLLPPITLQWCKLDDVATSGGKHEVVLPVYLNSGRAEVLHSVPLPLAEGVSSPSMYERGSSVTLWGGVE